MTVKVLIGGQSNALGRGSGGPNWSSLSPLVRVWNNVNPLGANGTAFVTPATALAGGTFQNTDRNNFGVWFCDRLARSRSEAVDMTIVARGDTSIEQWSPGSSLGMLEETIAVWQATGQGPADIFAWHQGEGNNSATYAYYSGLFLALLSNLTAAGVIGPNTIVIVGGVAETQPARVEFNQRVLQPMAADNANIWYARSDGLTVFDVTTHFDGWALYQSGADRYFNALTESTLMANYWAHVNSGGTPGVEGSGTNSIVNIGPLLETGYRVKGPPIIITANQTYTKPADVDAIYVEVQGGGGGGGGASSSGGFPRCGSGGTSGARAEKLIIAPLASYACTIGAGGAGGAAGQNNGSPGGQSSFGSGIVAEGGAGGNAFGATSDAVIVNTTSVLPSASGGDLNVQGEQGGFGIKISPTQRMRGGGGNSKYGRGGAYGVNGNATSNNAGTNGVGYGTGGGGGASSDTVDQSGGNGMPGVIIITEYLRG